MTEHSRVPDTELGCDRRCHQLGFDRREFLFAAGASLIALSIPNVGAAQGRVATYPRKVVASLGKLQRGEPVPFRYPWDHVNCDMVLLKLGQEAAGAVGPDKDVVAFSSLCPHMGWGIPTGMFYADPGIAGPCPGHWTTFDLTRHGMVVSGHATQGLPQVVLELDGDDVIAVGILGLIFGFHNNRVEPRV